MSSREDVPRVKASHYPLLALGVWLLAAFLFFFRIGHHSYWMDELQTAERIAHRTQAQIWAAEEDPQSEQHYSVGFLVTYYSVAKAWASVFGHSEGAVRSLSAVSALVALAMILALGPERWRLGRRASLVAGGIFALSPMMLWYAQEARYYAFVQPFALAAAWFYWEFWRTRRLSWLAAWAGCSVVSLTIHPFMIFGVVALSLVGLAVCIRARRVELSWAAVHLVVALVFLFLMQALSEVHRRHSANENVDKVTSVKIVWQTLSNYLCGVYEHPPALLTLSLVLAALAALALHLIATWKRDVPTLERAESGAPFWIAAALGGFLLMAAVSTVRPIMVEGKKYEFIFFAPFCVWLGCALSARFIPRAGVLLFLAIMGIGAWITDRAYYFQPQKQNWRVAGAAVERLAQPGDAWIHQGTWRAFAAEYYAPGVSGRVKDVLWKPPDLERGLPTPTEVMAARRVWLVATGGIAELYGKRLESEGLTRSGVLRLESGTYFRSELWLFERASTEPAPPKTGKEKRPSSLGR